MTRDVVGMDDEAVVGALSVALERAGRKLERVVSRDFVDVGADPEVGVASVSRERAGRKPKGWQLRGRFGFEGAKRS